ncbi:hypothetical protein F5888DRAFT_1711245 [Russula emetica]|nr:hypothetical protein F5888DRAFT_1711245 [Russula emetica]
MSPLAAPLATFLFFLSFAAAQIYAPSCSPTLEWTFNSLGQNPCMVAAYLMETCSNDGSFTIYDLSPGGSPYNVGSSGTSSTQDSNLCMCNTVTYSLLSACDACQGVEWNSWSAYSLDCIKTLPPSSFPNPIPSGTRVPQWALIDIISENNWDPNQASAVGDSPEQAPGARLGSPTPKSSSNTDVIVGGAVGGVATIGLVVIAIGFFLRRRRRGALALVAPPVVGASQPPMDEIQQPLTMDDGYAASSIPGTIGSPSMPGTPIAPMGNDPNYSSTFPVYQGVPQTPATPPQGAVPSLNGTGNSLATMQTSRQQGYHGLPIV